MNLEVVGRCVSEASPPFADPDPLPFRSFGSSVSSFSVVFGFELLLFFPLGSKTKPELATTELDLLAGIFFLILEFDVLTSGLVIQVQVAI